MNAKVDTFLAMKDERDGLTDCVMLSLSSDDGQGGYRHFLADLTPEQAEALARELEDGARRVRWAAIQARQEEERAARIAGDWCLVSAGHDERGELVYVTAGYGSDWPAFTMSEAVPFAEGQRIRDEHNATVNRSAPAIP